MKLVIIEPLGVEENLLMDIAKKALSNTVEIVSYNTKVTDTKSLIERGKEADVIMVANLPLNAEVINGCENLKMLAVAFTGIDHIDMDACRKRGIVVSNCAGYSNAAVSDLVFGLLISLYRNIIPCNDVVRNEGTKEGLVGLELEGKKFGVIGTGAIGTRVANIAKAFGCEVYAYSRTKKELPGITYVDLPELLAVCDIVSLHVPLNDKTKGMIGRDQLACMKKEAVLINTARGPVVDSEALANALNEERISGAAVDVFEEEPPVAKDHPLFSAKNLIATPHVAFATKEALIKRAKIDFDNVKYWLEGNPVNVMN